MDEKIEKIMSYLNRREWVGNIRRVRFLAAGEYNENYTVHTDERIYVFRINHGSQLNIDNQIEYEYTVLKTLESCGVTPKPFFYDLNPDSIEGGVLLMEYIPGSPLNYTFDTEKAACIFAKVHTQEVSDALTVQRYPVNDIAAESLWLINKYTSHPLEKVKRILLSYHEKIIKLAEETESLFSAEDLCIVNTEVNSHNFIVQGEKAYLVDWEKAVVSCAYQDLAHFVVPTTTLWKSDFIFDEEKKTDFLRIYARFVHYLGDLEELKEKTAILEKTILLRALSWCFMAYYEYTRAERVLKNNVTFRKIQSYLREIECFLK